MTTKEQNKLQVSEYTPQQISFEVFTAVTTVTNLPLPLFGPQRWDFSWFHPWNVVHRPPYGFSFQRIYKSHNDFFGSFMGDFFFIFSKNVFFIILFFIHFRSFSHVIFSLHLKKNTLFNFHTFSHWNMLQIWVFLLLQLHLQFEELKRYDTDWKKQSPVAKGLNCTWFGSGPKPIFPKPEFLDFGHDKSRCSSYVSWNQRCLF